MILHRFSVVLILSAIFAGASHGQGVDDASKSSVAGNGNGAENLPSKRTGDRIFESPHAEFLNEGAGSDFDPRDELDAIPSFRIEKKIAAKKKEIVEARNSDARMASECRCVFVQCPTIHLQARLRDDLSPEAKRLAERHARAYDARTKAKKKARKAACLRWKEMKQKGGASALVEKLDRQLEALNARSSEEREIEKLFNQQRRADKQRRLAEEKRRIEAAEASRRERIRQAAEQAAARHREIEAEKLASCRERWAAGRNPCGCGNLPGAPVCKVKFCTCEK